MKHLRIKPILLAAAIATIMLVFACGKDTFILSAVPNNPSYGSVSGSGEYKNGEEAILTATPYSGYRFVDWSDGMRENPRTVIMYENTSLKANFDKMVYYNISVNSNNTSWGTVSGGGSYPAGATATLKATPKSGYSFERWNDGNTNATRTVTVNGNATYTATFKSNTTYYTITVVSANTNMGYVTGGGSFASGTTTTIKAIPYSGYAFERWNDGNTNATRTITVTGNATYTATFKSSGGGGNNASMTVSFGGTTWTATSYIGAYWANDGQYVIGGKSDSDYPWFRMQLGNISTGTYHAQLDTTQSLYWLNSNVNIVQYYENYYLTMGDDSYQYGDWQGWSLYVNITSLTSSTISFTIGGYMYSLSQAACEGCDDYVGSFAGAEKRYLSVSANNIPFTNQKKGSPETQEGALLNTSNNKFEPTPKK
ncbi:MAG: hypothetical protein J6T88_09015 [Bacteroidales bacterium]|nr:hypothetical protein [Bacteroidales bacterium]